jgi:hypothetical protein
MGTLSAQSISDALAQARNVGIVEEPFAISNCALVLRNLRPDEYSDALKECEGLQDMDFLSTYQKGHIARSLVEVNGIDFRDVDFVEVEDEKHAGKVVRLEKYAYLLKFVVRTWSKEVVDTVYRKFGDVCSLAETRATEGVKFILPQETPEEKYRRLLGDMKEIEDKDGLPETLLDSILDENGLMRKSVAEKIKSDMEQLDQLAREQEAKETSPDAPPAAAQPATPVSPAPAVVQTPTLQEVIAQRRPALPQDPHQALQQTLAGRQSPPGPEGEALPLKTVEGDILAQELGLGSTLAQGPDSSAPVGVVRPAQVAELVAQGQERIDLNTLRQAVDKPPAAGLNPRFRPPRKL